MTVRSRVRKIYERRPYPPPALRAKVASAALPAPAWIETFAEIQPGKIPARILVAGCGIGTEAFALANKFPQAQIVAVDFSPRSIAIAKRQRRSADGGDRITFAVGDLTSAALVDITGDGFDLITCHGVLSYVPDIPAALRNFALLLKRGGALILGVNGASHPSARWRPLFEQFEVDAGEFRESTHVRDVIGVLEAVTVFPPTKVAKLDAGYLAGDFFGPLNRTLPLSEWIRLCRDAGLHFFSSHYAFFGTRSIINEGLHSKLIPRTRAQVAELIDAAQPMSFHRMVLSRRRPFTIPWNDRKELLRLAPELTSIYKMQLPPRSRRWHRLVDVTLESQPMNTSVKLEIPQWEVEILQKSDGVKRLREILAPVRPAVSASELRDAMYLLYLLGALNFRARP